MAYVLKEKPAHPDNYGASRSAGQIRYLVLHYTGNDGDTAADNAAYFQRTAVGAGAHYFVDDMEVYRSVPELKTAWAVGGKRYGDGEESGGRLYGIVTNRNSLSVELCGTAQDGSRRASEATLENAVRLCRELMARYGIPVENVCRHFDVTGKRCPAYLVPDGAWAAFRRRLEETMTQTQFDAMLENYLARRAGATPADSSREARRWAEENGIIGGFADGSKQYRNFCTREQLAIALYRLCQLLRA